VGFFSKRKAGAPVAPLSAGTALPTPPPAPRRRSWLWFGVLATARASAVIVPLGALATGVLFLSYSLRFPDPLSLAHRQHTPVIHLLARDGAEIATRGVSADYMPLDLLPPHVVDAVIATEDRRFFSHWGIDPLGMARALFANLRAGRFAQGGSTLTQQLAKNLFLTGERKLGRKLEELTFALWLELRLAKRDILELYLNRVYFGGGAYGIEAASQRYFGKSVQAVSVAEAAVLAGLLKAPSKYSPAANPAAARARGRIVLANMTATGVLTARAALAASDAKLAFAVPPQRGSNGIEYAVEYALERMPPIRGSGPYEVFVETTLDSGLQRSADKVVKLQLEAQGANLQTSQASVVLLEPSGAIRALVGGRSYADSQFNRAVKAHRQPGSAFKMFVYLTAMEQGLTPDTTGYDLPLSVKGWSPKNDNGHYQGAMPLRQALATSINTVAVRLYLDLPKRRVIETARRLGITSDLHDAPALALGASEVSLMELTQAYAVLANGGAGVTPHIIERVRLASGEVLYQHTATPAVALVKPAAVERMNDMLSEVLLTGTGKRAALAGHQAAGKTGTTQDFRDAWFIGYTAQLTAGVWVGNDSGQPMNHVTGGALPARIWHDVMEAAHRERTPMPLPGARSNQTAAVIAPTAK
jgi:penicillin-binding protein 1A